MSTVIWKLDKSIDEIYELSQATKTTEKDQRNLSINLTYEWSQVEKQKISNLNCVTSLACIDIFTGFNVNTSISQALFVNYNNTTYCNVTGAKGVESKIRTKLMEKGKNSPWGRVEFRAVNGYVFEKDFFYWLLSKKGKKMNANNTMILNISEFHCNTDRNADNYSGISKYGNIDGKPPLQALISAYEDICSLQVYIKHEKYQYVFRLDKDGRTEIKIFECGEFGTQDPHPISLNKAIIDIYYIIIPLLKKQYNRDMKDSWKENILPSMKKENATSLINTMLNETGLSINDIVKFKATI